MAERSRIKDVITHPRSTLAILLMAGVAIAGCGNTKSADNTPVGKCGGHDYSKASGPLNPGETPRHVISVAEQDVLILHERALNVGGSIDLQRYDDNLNGNVNEVTASQDSMRLNFDRSTWMLDNPTVDHVDFSIKGNVAHVSKGSVICYDVDNQQLATNGTFGTLQQYTHETTGLDK